MSVASRATSSKRPVTVMTVILSAASDKTPAFASRIKETLRCRHIRQDVPRTRGLPMRRGGGGNDDRSGCWRAGHQDTCRERRAMRLNRAADLLITGGRVWTGLGCPVGDDAPDAVAIRDGRIAD